MLQADGSEVWPRTIVVSGTVTAETIQQAIREAEERLPKRQTVQDILEAVALEHGVSRAEPKGPSRRRDLSEARVQAALLARERPHIRFERSGAGAQPRSLQPVPCHPSEVAMNDLQERLEWKVRAMRLEHGWSQEKLAEYAGLHSTYISSIERRERNLSLRNIGRLASS